MQARHQGVAAALALSPLVIRIPYYLFHGPRTCSFPTSALYGKTTLALAASLLMVAAAYLLLPANPHPDALRPGIAVAMLAAVLAMASARFIWRDVREIRAASA